MADASSTPHVVPGLSRRRRWARRTTYGLSGFVACVVLLIAAGWISLDVENSGTPSASARSSGQDAEWLGHAWVDGRKTQADVDALATQLRGTGVRDLFVHAGPFCNDGTLDPALRPRATWVIDALHAAMPGIRVQAWLGAHPVSGQVDLGSPTTRAHLVTAIGQVLDDGFDGVHLDFEPVDSGNEDLVTLIRAAHVVTQERHAILSISASLLAPVPGMAAAVSLLPGAFSVWSAGYLHELAVNVDQVAVMAYDTWLPTPSTYSGYVRRLTSLALDAVPPNVALFIGVPAYHDGNNRHHPSVETVANALRGVRLALGSTPPARPFGVAIYVDFTVTPADWASYRSSWND